LFEDQKDPKLNGNPPNKNGSLDTLSQAIRIDQTWRIIKAMVFLWLLLPLGSCKQPPSPAKPKKEKTRLAQEKILEYFHINQDIRLKDYLPFMDSVAIVLDSSEGGELMEYFLVLTNPWVLDTLQSKDYYTLMGKGIFVYDENEEIILHKGDSLLVPDLIQRAELKKKLSQTLIDVNIPEYSLRIIEAGQTIYQIDVRVGRDEHKFLKEAGRIVELQTPIGQGEVVRIERDPWYQNPVTGKRYLTSRRDDGNQTKMAKVPFIEPTIDGRRQGSLLHPTTNSVTLGKAYSNGCVGMTEANMWLVYYHAPLGTKVNFRYDLKVAGPTGDSIQFPDIYHLGPFLETQSNLANEKQKDETNKGSRK